MALNIFVFCSFVPDEVQWFACLCFSLFFGDSSQRFDVSGYLAFFAFGVRVHTTLTLLFDKYLIYEARINIPR